MRRTMWLAVLLTAIVLAIAGIIPWMLRAPSAAASGAPATTAARSARPAAPVSRTLPGVTPIAANDGVASSDSGAASEPNPTRPPGTVRPKAVANAEASVGGEIVASRASSAPAEDQELFQVAMRGGAIGIAAALIAIVVVWRITARGGVRRQAMTLAGRGLRTHEVARRTGMSQDAVRTLLIPEVASRRGKSAS